eukprot:TRINITY_DN31_c0_g1_i1.p1 TRINITY_DN31_c0_g1~~TRINITY_DN31_c0_g1_i1.p1  ORF type:complete len:153 (+),score=58.57 TRINITY_DN31_c0_g1_i1:137-595(+)
MTEASKEPERTEQKKKKTFRVTTFRGIELDKLLEMKMEELVKLFRSRHRRRFSRGLPPKYSRFINKLKKAKKELQPGEKPKVIKTHYRNCIIVPDMVQSIVGVYNGKKFTDVEIKPEMIGHYLGEFAITYKPISHGKPGQGSTHGSKFVALK